MIKIVHHAFFRRWRDRAMGLLVAAIALIPAGLPKDVTAWMADQLPWAPSWLLWVISTAVVLWRLSVSAKALRLPEGAS